MRSRLIATAALMLAASILAGAETQKIAPEIKYIVTCYNGSLDSGSLCSGENFQPDGVMYGKGGMTCGYAGKVSEISWQFEKHENGADVYRFVRRFPADQPDNSTEQKTVQYADDRVVVFQDESQVVVIQPPRMLKLRPAGPPVGADPAPRGATQP